MPRFTSPFDGAQLFYRDYIPARDTPAFKPITDSKGQKITLVFIHGWPMSSLMFDHLMLPLCETHRIRCIAPDRRGFGSSDWNGDKPVQSDIDYNVFAQDTIYLLEKLDVRPFVFVTTSMGPGETILAHAQSQYIQKNCKGFVWIGPALPFPLSTPENPTAPSRAVWDFILDGLRGSRADYTHEALPPSLGTAAGCEISAHTLRRYENIVAQADALAIERCVQIITNKDFTEDLRNLNANWDTPILCVHGDQDLGCPYEASSKVVKEIVPRAVVKVYEKGSHGIALTHKDQFLQDLLDFVGGLNTSV
ncbi:hypothetical protein AJ80_04516 [Polytolypa hystricis UAMH7299]|uniref:AB hydrolase-1 domain-containing protein n=1 Tax=Polytolypa hystricis (strain UAMH7299) TaxID=1447883 RepID=A0A2B7YBP8_POLH7|nr:hypothetical protein AJ80_04516 [Polytolypa hystricis UAMH7299]